MPFSRPLVVFHLDERRYALHLSAVSRVVMAAEATPLPGAPPIVLGAVNVRGSVIPIIDVRKRFGLPDREMHPGDRMIIASISRRTVALVADAVDGVIERDAGKTAVAESILPGLEYVEGVVKLEDGLILIHDLEKFLSLEEEKALEAAMTHT